MWAVQYGTVPDSKFENQSLQKKFATMPIKHNGSMKWMILILLDFTNWRLPSTLFILQLTAKSLWNGMVPCEIVASQLAADFNGKLSISIILLAKIHL